MDVPLAQAKTAARVLRRSLEERGFSISHSQALEIVANQLGYADWNTASATVPPEQTGESPAGIGDPVPVLRIHDEAIARAFYVDYLGFAVEWEHRFEADLPLYMRVRRDRARFDLSEHHGDGTPGSAVWIPVADLSALHADLAKRPHPRLRPGIDQDAPGGPTMSIIDPFGNILRFCQIVN